MFDNVIKKLTTRCDLEAYAFFEHQFEKEGVGICLDGVIQFEIGRKQINDRFDPVANYVFVVDKQRRPVGFNKL